MSPKPLIALVAVFNVSLFPLVIALSFAAPVMAAPAKTAADYDLIEAAYAGRLPRVSQLLASGASVDAQDQNGYTALHWAAQAGWPLTSRTLIAKGARVDARDNAGRTPLLLATVRKQVEVARTLLAFGADPNMKDKDGNSPLDYARRKQMPAMVALFMNPGRELILPAHPRQTPAPIAQATPKPARTPKPMAHATPKPARTPKPMAYATPKPERTPKPMAHGTPKPVALGSPVPHPVGTSAMVASGDVALGAGFREEIGRLYGLYTDHLGMRDPENLKQKGFNQELEDKLEQIFHVLDYGSAPSLTRVKLHDARAWVLTARKRGGEPDADGDKVCNQLLESLDQLLAGVGF